MGVCDGAWLAQSFNAVLVVNRPTRVMGIEPPSSVGSGESLSLFGSCVHSASVRCRECDDKPRILIVSLSGGTRDATADGAMAPIGLGVALSAGVAFSCLLLLLA